MPKNMRVNRTGHSTYPYAWQCTIPDPESHTGECGASSFAATEALVAADHAAHVKAVHTKEA